MMVVVLTSCTADCRGLIITVLSLASYVWWWGLFMMNILSCMSNLYWFVRIPLSAVSVSIMMTLTVDPPFSASFQACHACSDMIYFSHVKNFCLSHLTVIPWLYVLTWAGTCNLSSPLLYHLCLRTAQLPCSHMWFTILVVQFVARNLLFLRGVSLSVKYSVDLLGTLCWFPKSTMCRLLMCAMSPSTTLDICTLSFLAFK